VNGAAAAFVVGNIGTVAMMMWQLQSEYRRVRRPKAA
jgi:hypothetical protein